MTLDPLLDIRTAARETVGRVVAAEEVALIDYPAHHNVGDHLIWLGERALLADLGIRIGYEADERSYSARAVAALPSSVPILLQGGGNFGDLWPDIQRFRERVVADHPGRRVVQLSQSVYFSDPALAARADRVFGDHPDLTLLVRDAGSLARAAEQLPSVRTAFCPDMALAWRPSGRWRPKGYTLVLARQDHEARTNGGSLRSLVGRVARAVAGPVRVHDWGLAGWRWGAWNLGRIPARLAWELAPLADRGWHQRLTAKSFALGTKVVVGSALPRFLGADRVITDRLHAHVLAGLLGIPHVVLDNSYGKIGAVYRDYTHRLPGAHFADSPEEALALLRSLQPDLAARSA